MCSANDRLCGTKVFVPSWEDVAGEVARRARPGDVVVTMGAPPISLLGDELLAEWQRRCTEHYSPARLTLSIPTEARGLPGVLALCQPAEQGVVAYVCQSAQCGAPIRDLAALDEAIRKEGLSGTVLPD